MKHSDQHPTAASRLRHHRIYGIDFVGDFPFTIPLPPGQGSPTLTVLVGADTAPDEYGAAAPVYTAASTESSAPVASVYVEGDVTRVHFPEVGDFLLHQDRITYRALPGADPLLAESRLLGPVFTLWLERRGTPVLHAATLAVDQAAAAFLSASHGGKSSLGAALVQAGAWLMSDDLLVAERAEGVWMAQPAYPQLRLWPETAGYFMGDTAELVRVHPEVTKLRAPIGDGFGLFQPAALPLRVIYIPQRYGAAGDACVRIEPLSSSAGLIELVRHSFLIRLLHLTGQQSVRLPILADLSRSVTMRRISYPSGVERLPAIAATIIEDVRSLAL